MNELPTYPAPLPRGRALCAAWAWHCLRLARKYRDKPDSVAFHRRHAHEWIAEGKAGSVALRHHVIYNARAGNRPADEGQDR